MRVVPGYIIGFLTGALAVLAEFRWPDSGACTLTAAAGGILFCVVYNRELEKKP